MPNATQVPSQFPLLNPYAAASPDYQAQQLTLARRQALAQALTDQGLAPIEYDPRGRVSPWQGVNKLASALLGGSMANQNIADAAKVQAYGNQLLQQGGFGLGTVDKDAPQITNSAPRETTARAAGTAPVDANLVKANRPDDPLAAFSNLQGSSSGGSASTSAPSMPQPGAYPTASRNGPLVLQGMSPEQAYQSYMLNPDAYSKALIERTDNRTDYSKMLLSMGIDPNSPIGRQLMARQVEKLNYIAPIEMRPGGGLMDPRSGAVTTMPAAAPAGFQNVQLADGTWGAIPVRGGVDAISQSTGATEAGKAPYQIVDTFANGRPGKNYAGNVMQLPSAGGAPQQSSDAATFNIGGSPQQQSAILADIARRGPTPDVRAAAMQRLQQIQSGGGWQPQGANGVQTGPAVGEAQGAVNAQDELSKAWSSQQQAQASAQTNISLLQSVKDLADKAITGYEPDRRMWLAQLGAYSGLPGQINAATSTDLLNKYSAQLIGSLSQKGMNTDAARDLVMAGTPNSHMQPAAIKEAVDGLIAREQMAQARTTALQPYAANRDPAGFQSAANRFDAVADPRLWQMQGMTPQQLQAFTAKMPAADARQLAQKYQAAVQQGMFQ